MLRALFLRGIMYLFPVVNLCFVCGKGTVSTRPFQPGSRKIAVI